MTSPQDIKGKYYRISAEWLNELALLSIYAQGELTLTSEDRPLLEKTGELISVASQAGKFLQTLHAES